MIFKPDEIYHIISTPKNTVKSDFDEIIKIVRLEENVPVVITISGSPGWPLEWAMSRGILNSVTIEYIGNKITHPEYFL